MSWFSRFAVPETDSAPPAPPAQKSGGAEKSPWLQAAPPAPPAPPEKRTKPEIIEFWLKDVLDSIQPAAILESEAVLMGYSKDDLNTALIAIGAKVSKCLGVDYWRLPDAVQP